MRFTKRQLVKIIREQVGTINDESIDDAVMSVLSDEGGAAGIDPIEAALDDLEDEDMSLPDEEIEDIISSVTGVKQHADGDFVDTTQLEGKSLKVTKRQLRRIIKEEKAKLVKEAGPQVGDSNYYSVSSADETELDMASTNLMSILRDMDPMERNPEIYDLIEMLETLATTGR